MWFCIYGGAVFGFNAGDAVQLVSLADFQACKTTLSIKEYDPTPGAVLTTATFSLASHSISTLYFIGKKAGACAAGQKFFLDVLN